MPKRTLSFVAEWVEKKKALIFVPPQRICPEVLLVTCLKYLRTGESGSLSHRFEIPDPLHPDKVCRSNQFERPRSGRTGVSYPLEF